MLYTRFKFIVFAGLLLIITGCQFFKPVEISQIKSFRIAESKGFGVSLSAKVELVNPNPGTLKLKHPDIEIWVDNNLFGKLTVPEKIEIPGNDSLQVECKMDVPLTVLLSTGKGVLKKVQNGSVPIVLKGTIEARYYLFKKQVKLNASHVVEF